MSEVQGRREFLKKAGTVAWVVPTIQVVNMSAAFAGDDVSGSVVSTTNPSVPECSCHLDERGREVLEGDLIQVQLTLTVSDSCVQHAAFVGAYVDGEFVGGGEFGPDWYLTAPADAFPLTLLVKVYDAQENVLTACDIYLEGFQEDGAGGVAKDGGRIRFHR